MSENSPDREPKIRSSKGFEPEDDDSGIEEVDTGQRSKVPFGTILRPALLEKLRAAAFWTEESIASIVARALRRELARMEEENGEPFEVLSPHEVED